MEEDEYEKLLERAFAESPSQEVAKQDFEIPKVDSMIQGSKTIIRNINAIADRARRKPDEIGRYLSKELSVPVSSEEQRLIINGRFSSKDLDAKIERYFNTYVICRECHKPDTHLELAGRGMFSFVCEACGAHYGVKSY